ncbi:MAG: hydrogenase formation protein HypD [Asgard group archaeon]|nr:hydrogenase formation protein HypD [Asgard group archaeon]
MKITRDKDLIKNALEQLKKIAPSESIKITHVCGTHEMTASRYGIRSILPKSIEIIPGPGCPVCVCPSYEIDYTIELAKQGHIITTFGDMLKVPASKYSLAEIKRNGYDIRVVYSPKDAIEIALKNTKKEVVFLAIGFETSAPMTGDVLLSNPPKNFSILSAHRLTVPAMELLLKSEKRRTKGFICPGHVSVIIGTQSYLPFSSKYKMPCVIAGFEAIDMIVAIIQILKMNYEKKPSVVNEYSRVVKPKGNVKAQSVISEAFEIIDANWRGIGLVEKSGLAISNKYQEFDAFKKFNLKINNSIDIHPGCKCHEVMLGNMLPDECKLFMRNCMPDKPIGPCMVSHEGTCSIFARYGSGHFKSSID